MKQLSEVEHVEGEEVSRAAQQGRRGKMVVCVPWHLSDSAAVWVRSLYRRLLQNR